MNDDYHVTIFLVSSDPGGAEKVLINLANEVSKEHKRVDIVLGSTEGELTSHISEAVKIIDLNSFSPPVLESIVTLPGLTQYFSKHQPDVVITGLHHINFITIISNGLSNNNARVILTLHNTYSQQLMKFGEIKKYLYSVAMPQLYSKGDEIVACSKEVKEDFCEKVGIPEDEVTTIYNPVVTEKLKRQIEQPVSHPWFTNDDLNVITGLSNLRPQKDYETFLKAIQGIASENNLRAYIMGDGPCRESLVKLSQTLGISDCVEFPGFVDNPYKFIRASDCFVLSTQFEGLPTVLIEALAAGTPVISSDCPSGPREILADGEYGDLVPVGNPEELRDTILANINQPHDNEKLVNRANDFSLSSAANKYSDLFK